MPKVFYNASGPKALDVLVSPGELFDALSVAPPRMINWMMPTLLSGLAAWVLLRFNVSEPEPAAPTGHGISGALAVVLSMLASCLVTLAATAWSAFVLWFVGRVFLKSPFAFAKAMEVVGFSSIVMLLGTVITCLLIAACGNEVARPALSLAALPFHSSSRLLALLDSFNVFHLWAIFILAVGLSRLSRVTFSEAVFWVFGYWFAAPLALMLLS